MDTKLFLIRHGQTDWNSSRKLQGHRDLPLNDIGTKQALKVAASLAGKVVDVIYSSDLQRAYTTALKIADYHQAVEIKTLPGLREIDFGRWEGLTYKDIEEQFPGQYIQWCKNPVQVTPPNGESVIDFQNRVVSQFKEINNSSNGKNVVIVTHGGTIRMFLTYILKMPVNLYWKLEVDHCNISIIQCYGNEYVLKTFNCSPG